VPDQRVPGNTDRCELLLSLAIVITTAASIWLLASGARWIVCVPVALIILLWRRQSQTLESLGLRFFVFVQSLREWRVLWIATTALFLFVGWHTLLNLRVLQRGCVYFLWCLLQQLAFQSVVWSVLRKHIQRRWAAAVVAGLIFALLHAPNTVLMLGTFFWGFASSLLFESCRSVIGLALLQVMLSSLLFWLVPYRLHHGLRVGPSYYLAGLHRGADHLQDGGPSGRRRESEVSEPVTPPQTDSPRKEKIEKMGQA